MALRYAIFLDHDESIDWAAPILEKLEGSSANHLVCKVLRHKSNDFAFETNPGSGAGRTPLNILGRSDQDSALNRLNTLDLDFVVCLAQKDPPKEFASSVLHGWWRYRFGQSLKIGDAGVAEILAGASGQRVYFEKYGFGLDETELKEGYFKLKAHDLRQHRLGLIEMTSSWPLDVAREIGALGRATGKLSSHGKIAELKKHHHFVAGIYQWIAAGAYLARMILRQFVFQQWNVGTFSGPIDEFALAEKQPVIDWWNPSSNVACLADPFPVIHDGKLCVFAEKFDCVNPNGTISLFSMAGDGTPEEEREAIRFDNHLSYPCVRSVGDETFCVFEFLGSRELAIYRCEKFPHIWSRVSSVATGASYADPTLFFSENRWWIFATTYDPHSGGNALLNAWYSEDGICGNWKPHLLNPIKCDVESSRSAGLPFYKNKKLHRPVQNCLEYYGRSIVINRIDVLTPREFSEVKVTELLPDRRFSAALHHVAGVGDWTVVDGRRDRLSLIAGYRKIQFRLRNWLDAAASSRVPPKVVGAEADALKKQQKPIRLVLNSPKSSV